ncbi:hypothetical protein XM25_15385 [Devosia sp. H5989]|nr:hypothetical protein XM25_15385 [Devosia sp. H5989]
MSEGNIDLEAFCASPDDALLGRPFLCQPMHHAEWTVATNGHIAVRVPRIAGSEDTKGAPLETLFGIFTRHSTDDLGELPLFTPPEASCQCYWCEGTGLEPDEFEVQPTESSPCSECGGAGLVPLVNRMSVEIGQTILAARYFQMIRSLPFPRLSYGSLLPAEEGVPVSFVFEGGIGLLMGMRSKHETHVPLYRPGGHP